MKKNNLPVNLFLLIALILGATVRILFFKSIDGPILISDSETYIGGAKNLLPYLRLDEYRPPIYLLQLALCGLLFTWQNLLTAAVILQSIIGLFTVVILYKLVLEAFENRAAAYISAFSAAISITIYCWDFMLLTENLSIFLVTLLAYYLVLYLKYSNIRHLKILAVIQVVLVFTKPFFLALPILMLLIFTIKQFFTGGFRFNTHFKTALLGLAGIFLSVLIYSGINQFQHSFFGITTVGKVNTFGKILQYGMSEYGDNKKLAGDIREAFSNTPEQYIVEGRFPEPWHFIGSYGWNTGHYSEIGKFARSIMLKKPAEYMFKSVKLTGSLLVQSPFKDFIAESEIIKAGHPNKIMLAFKKAAQAFDLLYILILLPAVEILFLLIFRREKLLKGKGFLLLGIFLLILYHYLVSAFFSYGDYCRLLAPSYPLIYAVIALYTARLCQFVRKAIGFLFSKIGVAKL